MGNIVLPNSYLPKLAIVKEFYVNSWQLSSSFDFYNGNKMYEENKEKWAIILSQI